MWWIGENISFPLTQNLSDWIHLKEATFERQPLSRSEKQDMLQTFTLTTERSYRMFDAGCDPYVFILGKYKNDLVALFYTASAGWAQIYYPEGSNLYANKSWSYFESFEHFYTFYLNIWSVFTVCFCLCYWCPNIFSMLLKSHTHKLCC